jgi:hypothetical protein
MKRILLLIIFFCVLSESVLAAPGTPERIIVAPLFNFDTIFDVLRNVLVQLFFQYYHLVLGFIFISLILTYFQGMIEGRKMRQDRVRREQEYQANQRLRAKTRAIEKRLARERELISRYARVDEEIARRIQSEMHQDVREEEPELCLGPRDPDDLSVDNEIFGYSGRIKSQEYDVGLYGDRESWDYGGRGTTYWREDGTEEGSESLFDDTVTIGGSSTVEIRRDKRDRFHHGMDDDDDGGGY